MCLCQFAKGMSVYLARQVGLPQNQVDRLRLTPMGYRLIGRYDLLLSGNQRREMVTVAMFAAAMGIQPASFFLWYQPDLPEWNIEKEGI